MKYVFNTLDEAITFANDKRPAAEQWGALAPGLLPMPGQIVERGLGANNKGLWVVCYTVKDNYQVFFSKYPAKEDNELDKDAVTIGRTLNYHRIEKGVTLEDMQLLTKMNRQTLINMEYGKGSSLASLTRYCNALHLTINIAPEVK